jgi:phage terminase large subunit-like protein
MRDWLPWSLKVVISSTFEARLNALEALIDNRKAEVPVLWEDFARTTKIRSGKKLINFDPYPYQRELSDLIDKCGLTVITKSRQLGITELVLSKFLHEALKSEGFLGVVLSKTQQDTSNCAKRLRKSLSYMPEVRLKTDSLTDLEFIGGGRILFRNASINGCRGLESVSHILIDEASFINDVEEIYKAVVPATSMVGDDARIIVLSTPNGQTGWYWSQLTAGNGDRDVLSICQDIKEQMIDPCQTWIDEDGNGKAIIHWRAHPIYGLQDDYLERVRRRTGADPITLAQEYDLNFDNSEQAVFSADVVARSCVLDGLTKKRDKECDYFIGVDPAAQGLDYFVATVIEYTLEGTYRLVDMYRKRSNSSESNIFHINELIGKYQPRKVVCENNGLGQIILERLQLSNPKVSIEGVNTSQQSKLAIISRLLLSLEKGVLKLPAAPRVFAEELLAFRRIGNKLEAAGSAHDDIVMSLAIAMGGTYFTEFEGPKPKIEYNEVSHDEILEILRKKKETQPAYYY